MFGKASSYEALDHIHCQHAPHLTKNIVTCMEKLSMKNSKRNLKFGKAPVNLNMIEDIWMRMGGASGQLHSTKLTRQHFEKDLFSWMNMKFLIQILSASVVDMIHTGIVNDDIVLAVDNKDMYNNVANLCKHWNGVVNICNGQDGNCRDSPHTRDNAQQRQTTLLETLAWFGRWKELHDERVKQGRANRWIVFADETYFYIQSLLLSQIMAIQIYCVKKGDSINPQTMNTDTVEWHFVDAWQMVRGSTNNLSAVAFDIADKNAGSFNAANFSLLGNNANGINAFSRKNLIY